LNGEKTNVLKYPEDEDGDGLRNVVFFAIQPPEKAGSPRRFYYNSIVIQINCRGYVSETRISNKLRGFENVKGGREGYHT
jgi:hypothetical protein